MPKVNVATTIWKLSLKEFIDNTGKSKPLLTGGCVTIASACFAVSLLRMPLEISRKNADTESKKKLLSGKIVLLRKIHNRLIKAADEDLEIFDSFRFLPKNTPLAEKDKLRQEALLKAIELPLQAAGLIGESIKVSKDAIDLCNQNILSDMAAGVIMLHAALEALLILVSANINSLPAELQENYYALHDSVHEEAEADVLLVRNVIDNMKKRLVT